MLTVFFSSGHNFGDTGVYENMREMVFTAFDNGITHFDLANNYGPAYGSAETNLGKLLKENFTAYRSLDQSLQRMGLDTPKSC